ncbi:MAG: outer membrane protein, partial [Saprospiraceae bacterium]
VETNRENFERTKEEQKIGQISSIEYRQAQLNLLNAETNLNTARFAAKVIEMELLQLSGQLLGQ